MSTCDNQTKFCDAGFYCKNKTCTPCSCDPGKEWNKQKRIVPFWGTQPPEQECLTPPLKTPEKCVCPKNNKYTELEMNIYKENLCVVPGMEGKCDNKTTFCTAGYYCKNGTCTPCECDPGKVWDWRYIAGSVPLCQSAQTDPEECICPHHNTINTANLNSSKQNYCIKPPMECKYGEWYDEEAKECKDCPCANGAGYRSQPDAMTIIGSKTRNICPGDKKATIPGPYCVPKCDVGKWYDEEAKECKDCSCSEPGYRLDLRQGSPNYNQIKKLCPGYELKEESIPSNLCLPKCSGGQWYDEATKKCKDCLCQARGYNPSREYSKDIVEICPGYGLEAKTIPQKDCVPLCPSGFAINNKYPNGWDPSTREPDGGCKFCTCKNELPSSSGATYKLPTDPQTKQEIQDKFCPGYNFTNSDGDSHLIPSSNCELNCSKEKTWPKIVKNSKGVVSDEKCDTCLCNNNNTVVGFTTKTVSACPAKDNIPCNYIGKYLVCDEKDCYPYGTKPTSKQISSGHTSCIGLGGCDKDLKKPETAKSTKNKTSAAYWDCSIKNDDGKGCSSYSLCYRLCSWKYPTGYSTSSNNLPSGNNTPPVGW